MKSELKQKIAKFLCDAFDIGSQRLIQEQNFLKSSTTNFI